MAPVNIALVKTKVERRQASNKTDARLLVG
jgi:hypothetical protein